MKDSSEYEAPGSPGEHKSDHYATKADIANVRADLYKMDASIKQWTLATTLTVVGTMLAAIFGVVQVFKTSPPTASATQTSAPLIIQLPMLPASQPPAK